MENQLSEILDNLLGLLLLEGSYEIEKKDESLNVFIETEDAGRLIGARGESLEALQLIVNQILSKKINPEVEEFKRVIIDVSGWKKQKEEDLSLKVKGWIEQVLETKQPLELEPMPSWQRRIVHMIVGEAKGVESESLGEGRDRHVMIKLAQDNKQDDPEASEKPS